MCDVRVGEKGVGVKETQRRNGDKGAYEDPRVSIRDKVSRV